MNDMLYLLDFFEKTQTKWFKSAAMTCNDMQRLCPGLALLNVASTGLSVLRRLGVTRSTSSFRVLPGSKSGIPGAMALFTTVHCRLLYAAMLVPVKTCHKTCQNTSEVLPRT